MDGPQINQLNREFQSCYTIDMHYKEKIIQ